MDAHWEKGLWENGISYIAGVDEAGRGPLAGPVVAAAVMFPPETWNGTAHGNLEKIHDSKKLGGARREELYAFIRENAHVAVAVVSHTIIDEINIFRASLRAMAEAVSRLPRFPQHIFVDGPHVFETEIPCTPLVDGDNRCVSIAAASIVAKVTRDRLMVEMDALYPQYGFARHKGYGTKAHYQALAKFGPCEIHRKSFRLLPAAAR